MAERIDHRSLGAAGPVADRNRPTRLARDGPADLGTELHGVAVHRGELDHWTEGHASASAVATDPFASGADHHTLGTEAGLARSRQHTHARRASPMTANTAPNTTTVRPSRCLARHAIVRPARADMHRQYALRQRSGPHVHNAWPATRAISDRGDTSGPPPASPGIAVRRRTQGHRTGAVPMIREFK